VGSALFTTRDGQMVLLHGFIKKSNKTPENELKIARNRLKKLQERIMNKHIGSNFDDFLEEEGLREEATAAAVKRVIAWQFAQAMKARKISKTEMAARMHTSRMVVNRLLDEKDTSVTLATLARASVAVGAPLRFELGAVAHTSV